jgi:tetratricopeptide (TPR) repeat protein
MKMSVSPLTCFLIAPFGEKEHQLGGGSIGHFELIRASIKEIVESFPDTPINLKRADEIVDVGSVQETFIGALYHADVVVADLSATANANVFYELGIRFALRRGVTIPIWQRGTVLPADLRGQLGVEYDASNPLADREKFHQFLRQRLKGQLYDSPVYRVLPDLEIMETKEISKLRQQVADLEMSLKQSLLDESIQVMWQEAEQLLSKSDQSGALEKLKIAYDHAPRNLRLALWYGQLLSRAKRHDEAISVLEDAVPLAEASGGPTSVFYRELGMAYSRAGKLRLALDWLNKAVDEDPSDSDTLGIIGGVYKQHLDINNAIEAYERGFDSDPKSTYCLLNVLALLLVRGEPGDKVKVKRLMPDADRLTREAISIKSANQWAFFDRGHYLLFAGAIQEAKECFQRACNETKTIGELDSARKNLDLLAEFDVKVPGLEDVLSIFKGRIQRISDKHS